EFEAGKAEADQAARDDLPDDAQRGDDDGVGEGGPEVHLLRAQSTWIIHHTAEALAGLFIDRAEGLGGRANEIAALHGGVGFERRVDDEVERDEEGDRSEDEDAIRDDSMGARYRLCRAILRRRP